MDFDQIDRLEGTSGNEKFGLIIKKKKDPSLDQDDIVFKKPLTSCLSKLAAKKRELEQDKVNLDEDKKRRTDENR